MTPSAPLSRTYYYDGELLNKSTFVRDQQYVRDLTQYQNSFLYTGGIVQGLEASGDGTATLTIAPGMAINGNGVPLFVLSDMATSVASLQLTAGSVYYICLIYSDSIHDNTPQAQLKQTMTITERPVIAPPGTTAPSDPGQVPICTITVDANNVITALDATAGGTRVTSTLRLTAAPGGGTQQAAPKAAKVAPATTELAVASPETTGDGSAGKAPPIRGPLTIGTPADTDAELAVGTGFSSTGSPGSIARFDYSGPGKASGSVALGRRSSDGNMALIAASAGGNTVWSLDRFGRTQTLSDASLAKSIKPIDDALTVIAGMKAVSVGASDSQDRRLAILADDVETAAPALVGTTPDGHKTIDYDGVVSLLLEAVKTLASQARTADSKA